MDQVEPLIENTYVVVPYYNEETVINEVVTSLLPYSRHIIIVDDGSAKTASAQMKNLKGLTVLRHKINLGQGAAIQTGLEYALKKGASYIVTFDGDGQHDASDIPSLLKPLENGEAEISLGSRFITNGSHNATTGRKRVLKTGRLVNYFFTGLLLTDSHNGFRAFTRQAAAKFKLRENRMAHATEILSVIRKKKITYKEVPVRINYTSYSKNKGQSSMNSIRIFFDLVLHKLFE